MIKKLSLLMGVILVVLILMIISTYLKKQDENFVSAESIVFNFFDEMYNGNFDEAFKYLDKVKEEQVSMLEDDKEMYQDYWSTYGITITKETYNAKETEADVEIIVTKLDIDEIKNDVRIKLLDINPEKEDGTLITEDEVIELKNEYFKEAFEEGYDKYNMIEKTYVIKTKKTEDSKSWKIVNDKQIEDILFGGYDKEDKDKKSNNKTTTSESNIENKKKVQVAKPKSEVVTGEEVNGDIIDEISNGTFY